MSTKKTQNNKNIFLNFFQKNTDMSVKYKFASWLISLEVSWGHRSALQVPMSGDSIKSLPCDINLSRIKTARNTGNIQRHSNPAKQVLKGSFQLGSYPEYVCQSLLWNKNITDLQNKFWNFKTGLYIFTALEITWIQSVTSMVHKLNNRKIQMLQWIRKLATNNEKNIISQNMNT